MGVCYIETKNLDGETNLKQKNAHKDVLKAFQRDDDFKVFISLPTIISLIIPQERQVWICYENPNPFLYKFSGFLSSRFSLEKSTGNVELGPENKVAMDIRHFLLRGCSIRNTNWVIGLVAFTGHDTKVMLNSVRAKAKRSTIERSMNKQILIIFLCQV